MTFNPTGPAAGSLRRAPPRRPNGRARSDEQGGLVPVPP